MRYVQINDVHISDQPPRMRTASYLEDVLAKLEECVRMARELDADRIIITGDLFHRKNAAHTTHRTAQRVRDILLGFGAVVSIVPGNHDEAHGGYLDGQPILSVIDGDWRHGRIRVLDETDPDDANLYGIPWLNRWEQPDAVAAFVGYLTDGGERKRIPPLVFTHAPISLTPYPWGPTAQGWMLGDELAWSLPAEVAYVGHGHMHKGHELTHLDTESGDTVLFGNPGALSRATVAEDDRDREPRIAVIDYGPEICEVAYRPIRHRPAAEVFRLAEHEAAGERRDGIQALAQSITAAYAETVDEEYLASAVRAATRPEDVDADVWRRGQERAIAAIEGVE